MLYNQRVWKKFFQEEIVDKDIIPSDIPLSETLLKFIEGCKALGFDSDNHFGKNKKRIIKAVHELEKKGDYSVLLSLGKKYKKEKEVRDYLLLREI
jgi:hypothetical protein